MTRNQKLTLLSALYLAQGLPYGFFTQALPVLLRTANLSLPQIGLANLLTLPWALKFMWAPAVDRYQFRNVGLRRSWLLPIQFLSVLLYLSMGFVTLGATELSIVLSAFLLTNVLAASQDVATDGLAVDILGLEERGWGNAIQVAGYRIGMIIGGGVLLALYPYLDWSGVMFAMAGFALLCTWPVLAYKEPSFDAPPRKPQAVLKEMVHFFLSPGALLWLVVLLLYKFGHASASFVLRPWLVDQGYRTEDIAKILGTGAFAAGFAGAMAGGWLAAKFNRPKLLVALGILQLFAVASYLWPVLGNHAAYKVLISASLDHFTSGLATTVLFTLMMDACSRDRAASDYTAQACVVVISQGLAAVIGGVSAEYLGYGMHFALATLIGAIAIAMTAFIVSRKTVASFLTPQAGRLAALALCIAVAISASPAQAQDSANKNYEFSAQVGSILPRRIPGIREIMNGFTLRASNPTRFGMFEIDTFIANGSGDKYRLISIDYRATVWDDVFPAHVSLGFHGDYIEPYGRRRRFAAGWHFGGGLKQPIGNGFAIREDFKYRLGPGLSLLVLIGVSYEL